MLKFFAPIGAKNLERLTLDFVKNRTSPRRNTHFFKIIAPRLGETLIWFIWLAGRCGGNPPVLHLGAGASTVIFFPQLRGCTLALRRRLPCATGTKMRHVGLFFLLFLVFRRFCCMFGVVCVYVCICVCVLCLLHVMSVTCYACSVVVWSAICLYAWVLILILVLVLVYGFGLIP